MQTTSFITDTHLQQFQDHGFTVLERIIPDDLLALLREVADRAVAKSDAKADAEGRPRTTKHFISAWHDYPELKAFDFSPTMAEVVRAFVGDTAYLVFEQYVIKSAEKGGSFAWHQDSGYIEKFAAPTNPLYLTCWCALDDITEENGTVYMLPYERAGGREVVKHTQMEGDFDLVGYRGPDPGDPVICPAGSIAVFWSNVFHRSGPNTTATPRRVYLPQYSSAPILKADGSIFYICEPFLRDGEIVASL